MTIPTTAILLHSFALSFAVAASLLCSSTLSLFSATMSPSDTIRHVMIIIAMEAEANPFVEHLELKPIDDYFPKAAPFLAFSGTHGASNCQVTVITNGKDSVYGTNSDNVGTIPASMASFLALQKGKPDILINAGTAGGFGRKGAAIGDVFLITGVSFHDRRIAIPGFDTYGVGQLKTSVDPTGMAQANDWKTGICSTGDSLDKTDTCDALMLKYDAAVKDMEAASIAWSASLHETPFLGVKVVTDIVDGEHPAQEEFLQNLATASQKLQAVLPQVLEYVQGKKHSEL